MIKSLALLKQKRSVVKQYIKQNPNCTCKDIKRSTKIKIERIYSGLGEAYLEANVKIPKSLKKRNLKKQKEDVINFINKYPGCAIPEIHKKTGVNVWRVFGGIVKAYNLSGIKYPKKEVTSGVRDPCVIKRSNKYEKDIITLLGKIFPVIPKVGIKGGIVDCLIEYNKETIVVEIKDFRGKNNITMHEIKQLMRYLKSLNCNKGIIICPKESFPKRKNSRNVYKDNLTIQILSDEDLRGRSINLFGQSKKGTAWLE